MISDADHEEAYQRHLDIHRPCVELLADLSLAAQSDLNLLRDILSQRTWVAVTIDQRHRPHSLGPCFKKNEMDQIEAYFGRVSLEATRGIVLMLENIENNEHHDIDYVKIHGWDLGLTSKIGRVLPQLMQLVLAKDADALLRFARYFVHLSIDPLFPPTSVFDIDEQTTRRVLVHQTLGITSRAAFAMAQHLQGKKRQAQAIARPSGTSYESWAARVATSFCVDP